MQLCNYAIMQLCDYAVVQFDLCLVSCLNELNLKSQITIHNSQIGFL